MYGVIEMLSLLNRVNAVGHRQWGEHYIPYDHGVWYAKLPLATFIADSLRDYVLRTNYMDFREATLETIVVPHGLTHAMTIDGDFLPLPTKLEDVHKMPEEFYLAVHDDGHGCNRYRFAEIITIGRPQSTIYHLRVTPMHK